MGKNNYDFSGWCTKFGIRCSDGRTITSDAFKHMDGQTVPLVWNHNHNDPENILGNVLLEHRENEGLYGYASFNSSKNGQLGKEIVNHHDIVALSICANELKHSSNREVLHGTIREVSLVVAGANPGATIETVLSHSDETNEEIILSYVEDEPTVFVHSNKNEEETEEIKSSENEEETEEIKSSENEEETEEIKSSENEEETEEIKSSENKEETKEIKSSENEELEHADDNRTVGEIYESMPDDYKKVVLYLVSQALETNNNSNEEGDKTMAHNLFENADKENDVLKHSLTLDEEAIILKDAKRFGSLKDSFLQHSQEYGIVDIEYMFPDAKALDKAPDWIKRPDEWVSGFLNAARHSPFSRIKALHADITADAARAKGYMKGHKKMEEVFTLLKRTTSPTTIYKKQKLDKDDITDIVDFDVVAWLKTEMRMMLNEEIARAALVGDGRSTASDDKISETAIRPIWTDDELYTIHQEVTVASTDTDDDVARAFIKNCILARKDYRGSGKPKLYTTEDMLVKCLLLEDTMGRVIYDSEEKLKTVLRVSEIVTVPVMENQTRTNEAGHTVTLAGIIVNPYDYTFGADKGGAVSMFEDFDIDYNQEKYLIETRCSGSLLKPKSAIAIEINFQ